MLPAAVADGRGCSQADLITSSQSSRHTMHVPDPSPKTFFGASSAFSSVCAGGAGGKMRMVGNMLVGKPGLGGDGGGGTAISICVSKKEGTGRGIQWCCSLRSYFLLELSRTTTHHLGTLGGVWFLTFQIIGKEFYVEHHRFAGGVNLSCYVCIAVYTCGSGAVHKTRRRRPQAASCRSTDAKKEKNMQTLQSTGKWATFGAEWRQREKKSTEKSQEWSLTRIPRDATCPRPVQTTS